ncbi:hypothetical protein BG20_I2295 [Candidatus Nitrosarchaeum limnium BG20]|uniref:Uncharacterized protein n=2 Tax=Nitrosarchaeum TaxID=1007082 RepID=S2EB01_9ARCH|nr:hypothetical protein BG20_I2295 [Candidatus Nitrosarchaeum limnium BG20]
MPSDAMNFIVEMICSACSAGDCKYHQRKILAKDSITGLEIEARCACKNHEVNSKIG